MNANTRMWIIFTAVLGAILLILGGILAHYLSVWCWLVSPILFGVVIGAMVINGWAQVPHNHVQLVTFHGLFEETWKPGEIHVRFPLLGIIEQNAEVFLGEQLMELNLDESVTTGYGDGKVDFQDGSCPVVVYAYFKVTCPEKAIFGISDVYCALAEKIDGAVRSYLADLTIDEANELKDQLLLPRILNFDMVRRDSHHKIVFGTDGKAIFLNAAPAPLDTIPLWLEIRDNYGIEIKTLVISDIKLSDAVIAIRERLMVAKVNAEAAKTEAETTMTEAKATAKKDLLVAETKAKVAGKQADAREYTLQKEGEGLKKKIEQVKGAIGGDEKAALEFIRTQDLFASLNDKTVIIDSSSNSGVSLGTAFSVGAKATSSHPSTSAAAPAAATP